MRSESTAYAQPFKAAADKGTRNPTSEGYALIAGTMGARGAAAGQYQGQYPGQLPGKTAVVSPRGYVALNRCPQLGDI